MNLHIEALQGKYLATREGIPVILTLFKEEKTTSSLPLFSTREQLEAFMASIHVSVEEVSQVHHGGRLWKLAREEGYRILINPIITAEGKLAALSAFQVVPAVDA